MDPLWIIVTLLYLAGSLFAVIQGLRARYDDKIEMFIGITIYAIFWPVCVFIGVIATLIFYPNKENTYEREEI